MLPLCWRSINHDNLKRHSVQRQAPAQPSTTNLPVIPEGQLATRVDQYIQTVSTNADSAMDMKGHEA